MPIFNLNYILMYNAGKLIARQLVGPGNLLLAKGVLFPSHDLHTRSQPRQKRQKTLQTYLQRSINTSLESRPFLLLVLGRGEQELRTLHELPYLFY